MATRTLAVRSRVVERSPIFYGWVIWLVATVGLIATSPGQSFSVSLFNDHFIADFAMSRTDVSGLFGLGTFIASLSLTWVGRQMDRHGSRRVGTVVLILFAAVLMSLSVIITGPLTLFFAFFAIRFLGQGSLGLVSSTAIARWWEEKRGWVIGLSLVGFALWQSVYLTILQSLIDAHGWRTTWVILGAVIAVTVLPMWWFFMRDTPERHGLLPDGALPKSEEETEADAESVIANSWRLKEAMRTFLFWVFILGRIMPAAFGTGLIFHQVSIFGEMGYSAEVVAQAFGVTSIVSAMTTILIGRVISRLPRQSMVMAFQLFVLGSAMFLSMHVTQDWMLWVYAMLIGIMIGCGGTFDGTVWADMFGRHYLGEIRGFASTALVAGTSIGPILFGLSYDTFGSYDTVRWVGMVAVAIPMILSLFMTKPRRRV
ncbi:MAG: hypothetical protein CL607_23280 [Anaerolineaceae bacterium]|nr:hypothetical protein [Anaerolineaceae bacterium]